MPQSLDRSKPRQVLVLLAAIGLLVGSSALPGRAAADPLLPVPIADCDDGNSSLGGLFGQDCDPGAGDPDPGDPDPGDPDPGDPDPGDPDPGDPDPGDPDPGTGSNPSGVAMPTANLAGWRHLFADDFTKDAALGSWANVCSPDDDVYTGAQGQKWKTYPNCYLDTYQKRPYRPEAVLSVGSGMLDFHLHRVDGVPAGANPSPVIAGGSQYQTYGRYSARMRVRIESGDMSEYHVAWLLWPQSEQWPQDGEIDFPEGGLNGTAKGYHHHAGPVGCGNGCVEAARDIGARFTDWHTYTIEWSPGRLRMLLDDEVVLDTTANVPSGPMRWQLQTETNGNGNSSGHLQVDWVSVWAYQN